MDMNGTQDIELITVCKCLPGELCRIMAVRWTSDEEEVVLEVPDESGKSTVDSSRSPWRQLLEEMENAGVTDTSVNGHDLVASTMAPAVDQGRVPLLETTYNSTIILGFSISARSHLA